jgi:hypothetical protein
MHGETVKFNNNYSPGRAWKIQGGFHLLGIKTVNDNDRGKMKHSKETLF